MATNGPAVPPRGRPRRRPWPLRAKIGLAGIAAIAAAWLIPKGGTAPAPSATPTPTPPGQLTAAEFPLSTIPSGVSFKTIDGVRVFLVRTGSAVVAFQGFATTPTDGPIFWCPKNNWFESGDGGPYYGRDGAIVLYSSRRALDRINVIVAAERVTIFPHRVMPGAPATFPSDYAPPLPPPPKPCSTAERVG